MKKVYKMIIKPTIFCIVGFAFGCSNQENFFNGKFIPQKTKESPVTLKGNEIDLEIPGVTKIYIVDTFLIVFTPNNDERFLSIYSNNSLKPLFANFARRGRGPNEFNYVRLCDQHYIDHSESIVWLNVDNYQKLIAVNITKSVKNQSLIIEKSIDFSKYNKDNTYLIKYITDTSLYKMEVVNQNMQLSIFNPITDKTYFKRELYTQKSEDGSIFSSSMIIKPDHSTFFSSMGYFDQANFIFLADKKQYSVSINKKPDPLININPKIEERRAYYKGTCFNDNIIVACHMNYNEKQPSVEFHVFNWKGELVSIIKTDKPITSICLDDNNGRLYGLDSSTEKIYYFDINPI